MTMSWAVFARSAGSSMAAPPYLMTTVLPSNWRMYGSASMSTSAFSIHRCMVVLPVFNFGNPR